MYVLARFIKTDNNEILGNIIRYNNSQNKTTASDFRSGDTHQKRLVNEFKVIPEAEYEGGRRGGAIDKIIKKPNLIPSYTVGQALYAFHENPIVAYNKKMKIWEDDSFYSDIFNEQTNARHIVFVYSLLRAIEQTKEEFVQKGKNSLEPLTESDESVIAYFRQRGSIYLYLHAISKCLEIFIKKAITNKFKCRFKGNVTPKAATNYWSPIINATLPFTTNLNSAISDGLKNKSDVENAVKMFKQLVGATAQANKNVFEIFAKEVEFA